MRYLLLYFIVPAAVTFLAQSILCRKVKRGILRYGALILTIIPVISGFAILLTQYGDIFGGLDMLAAALWFANACCAAFGYGAAWLIFLAAQKRKNTKQKGRGRL